MATKSTKSILDRIAQAEQNKMVRNLDISAEVAFVLACPKLKRERDVLVINSRYGLTGEKPKTLEEIGKELGITRERVRQIEKNAIRKLVEYMATQIRGQEILSTLESRIKRDGGVVTKSRLYEIFLGSDNANAKLKHMVCFLASLDNKIMSVNETTSLKPGYALGLEPKTIDNTIDKSITLLGIEKKPIEEKTFLRKIEKSETGLNDEQIVAIISLSKKILRTDIGHLGLSEWREINPRSIRDKTYYVLKKYNKPLHFTDISAHIESLDENKKKVTKQAVHNELIRDDRFVLIGRGIYALSEWGYNAGVVEKVIEEILISAGKPMHKDDIINEVMKRRIVKETTILLNLQKERFERVAKATYAISSRRG
jgi:DNA-directed RNA polymerase delta subunit/transcriptional regulator